MKRNPDVQDLDGQELALGQEHRIIPPGGIMGRRGDGKGVSCTRAKGARSTSCREAPVAEFSAVAPTPVVRPCDEETGREDEDLSPWGRQ